MEDLVDIGNNALSSSSSSPSISYLHNKDTAFPILRFVVQARFAPLLPYLSDKNYYRLYIIAFI
jgi:hypothetical protein